MTKDQKHAEITRLIQEVAGRAFTAGVLVDTDLDEANRQDELARAAKADLLTLLGF